MNWSKIRLIFLREFRDQLRDRRTLFTVLVLPLLLYPLMAIVMMQVSQFMREHPTYVQLIGSPASVQLPPLLEGTSFHPKLLSPRESRLLILSLKEPSLQNDEEPSLAAARRSVQSGRFDAAVLFAPDFAERLLAFQEALHPSQLERDGMSESTRFLPPIPSPYLILNTTNDKSRMALDRVERVLLRWREAIIRETLKGRGIPPDAIQPFRFEQVDVAREPSRRAALWSKLMPFVVLVWALTGAFYPAVDLCAGEKERGTLETLLSSPAERSEIVWGKLLTVMSFSIATALLNMLSMGATALLFMRHFAAAPEVEPLIQISMPPLLSFFWILMALIPASALFSALALSIAAFARSTKEGHYYLMPLLFIILPLMLFPTLPTVELTLGTSMIPLAGLMLLLRSVMEGEYGQAVMYFTPVTLVTAGCCLLAIRWAIDQFSSESVLFRESERGGVQAWLRHVARKRGPTPSVAAAILLGVVLLVIKFVVASPLGTPETVSQLVVILLITQVGLIALPALGFTYLLTRSPRQTLLLQRPQWATLPAALLLAVFLNPVVYWLGIGVEKLYPMDSETLEQLKPLSQLIQSELHWGFAILLIGLLPAICEELAFRGFILSGLRHLGHRWGAIVLSAIFFGLIHGVLQQQLTATITGVLIGYLAVRSGSLYPAMLYHFAHNSLVVVTSRLSPEMLDEFPLMRWIFTVHDESLLYHGSVALLTGGMALGILLWFRRLPMQSSLEEELTRALDRQAAPRDRTID
jgi:sodium transport system permease protein